MRSGGWKQSADITGLPEKCRMRFMVMPNQLGMDEFDLEDALGEQKNYMCSPDMKEFIEKYHLNPSMDGV